MRTNSIPGTTGTAGATSAGAPAPATAQPPAPWTVDDVVMTEQAGGFDLSPDGRWAVWVRAVPDREKDARISNLMLTALDHDEEIELTRGMDNCTAPRWSPDGKHIAFLTPRAIPKSKPDPAPPDGPKTQIWLIRPSGGEAYPLTELKRDVTQFAWQDANAIVFRAQEDPTHFETDAKEARKDTSNVVEDEAHAPPERLFRVALADRKVTRLTLNTDRIQSFALSPDGRHAVTVHERSLRHVYDARIKPVVFLYDLQTGDGQQIFTEPNFNIVDITWARDGAGFYAASDFSSHPHYTMASVARLYYYDLTSAAVVPVPLEWDNGLAAGVTAIEEGFLALLASGARNRAARYKRIADGWSREWLTGEHAGNLYALVPSTKSPMIAYLTSTASTPPRWYAARLTGKRLASPRALTKANPHFARRTIARTEVIRWKGARDEEVEGILYYPHAYEKGKRYPLVVMIHGGPAGADMDAWSESWAYPQNLMNQRGAFVLKPNYHGSSNYGLAWVESIGGGNYCDLETVDIERGVDSLIRKGLVDPEQLGVLGWSNGAILTIALTVSTTRYRAASAGAGDVEWVSDWGNCQFGAAFDHYYFGAHPHEDPDLYRRKSPFFQLDKVETPTLIFFGTEDRAVPTQQGWLHYRGLQQHGKTEVRFVLFPGEEHSPQKLVHQRRKLEEELAWFDRHMFKTHTPPDEALKADSPLAAALKRSKHARDGRLYGVRMAGILAPETVQRDALRLGRFEVTRAQYAEFDPDYAIEPGTGNHPANGITHAQAIAYCAWLAERTGQLYRLGTTDEMRPLYAAADKTENTLDWWAGYAPNLEDAARLRAKLGELPGEAPLLREVGSFAGSGDDPVYDLGGNVAEWTTDGEGKGVLLGGSADLPTDPRLTVRAPAAAYCGFRVVLGPPAAPQG